MTVKRILKQTLRRGEKKKNCFKDSVCHGEWAKPFYNQNMNPKVLKKTLWLELFGYF